MTFLDNLYIQKFHESKIEKFGSDNAKSLAWFDETSQLRRFEVLCRIGNLNNKSILDAGCGNGDLCVYLSNYFTDFSYHGFDIVSDFLNNAIDRTAHIPQTHFYLADFMTAEIPVTDYVFACGSLNYKNSDPEFIFKALTKLYASCKYAFGFNLLSSTLNPDGILCTYKPEDILTFCKTLSVDVQFIDDYEEGEFAVMMHKHGRT